MAENREQKKACIEIENKFDRGAGVNWTDKDFSDLSSEIYQVSHIVISITTLKRLFGKIRTSNEIYNPQVETKNAISQYLGFENWDQYVRSQPDKKKKRKPESIESNIKQSKKSKVIFKKLRYIALVSAMIVIAIAFLFRRLNYGTSQANVTVNTNSYQFSTKYNSGTFPFTAVIDYEISEIPSDNIYVDFCDSFDNISKAPVLLSKKNNMVTHSYLIPDFYKAFLIVNGKRIDSIEFHAKTKDWQGIVTYKNIQNNYVYYPIPSNIINDGFLYCKPDDVFKLGVSRQQGFWIEYRNVREYGVTIDDMTLETRIRNHPDDGGIYCNDIILFLRGKKGHLQFNLLKEGCTQWAILTAGDIKLKGQDVDLKAMGQDVTEWADVKLIVKGKTGTIFYNAKEIYQFKYNCEIGELVNIEYVFKGCGKVDNIRINDSIGKELFSEDF